MAVLMCRPDFFGIEYEINPWMKVANAVNRDLAIEQWEGIVDAYKSVGEKVELLEPIPGLPDMVFTANGGLIWGNHFVRSNMHHPERQGEEPYFEQRMRDLGFEIDTTDKSFSCEGAGDGMFVGSTLFFGSGFRTQPEAHKLVADILDVEHVSLQLVNDHFYHLDTCFCPLNDDTVMIAPMALTPESVDLVRARVRNVIEVDGETARGFACNALPVGDLVISSTAIDDVKDELRAAGFGVMGLPVTEFKKSGGGVRCLTLPLVLGPVRQHRADTSQHWLNQPAQRGVNPII
jgi:N-dimethylarginine dimethylaminohydrolase